MYMSLKWIAIIMLLAVAVIFTAQNYEVVEIQFLFWSFEASRAIIIFLSLLVGIVIGLVIPFMRRGHK
jgi:uncharacterized integral membrane protein